MIGTNILLNPNEFNLAYDTAGGDIAVHTWTHPYMTTLDDLSVLGQLGWSMQLIHNSTGGRVPKYWRPPYGDSDNRVRAIAKEIFGLSMIMWNQECASFFFSFVIVTFAHFSFAVLLIGLAHLQTRSLVTSHNGSQVKSKEPNIATIPNFFPKTGPKSPGLIILHHELQEQQVQNFINAYPLMLSNGWNPISASRIGATESPYQNTDSSGRNVTLDDVLVRNPPQGLAVPSSSEAPT
jgi:peptidoglycan/xylan/chitin deacetylase (PgdA/CDA1 family)